MNLYERILKLEKIVGGLSARTFMRYVGVTAWTPALSGSTTPGTITYTTQDGWYARIEPVVLFGGRVAWSAIGAGAGNAQYSLPPLTPATPPSGTGRWIPSVWTSSLTIGAFNAMGLITQGTAFFTLHTPANNAATVTIAIEAAGDVIFSGWYFV